jgi:hypothetical protein
MRRVLRLYVRVSPFDGATPVERILHRVNLLAGWWAAVGLVALCVGLPLLLMRYTIPKETIVLVAFFDFLIPGLAIVIPATIAWHVAWRRGRALVAASGCRLCPACLYELSREPPRGRCPECGTPYLLAELEAAWARSYRLASSA